MSIAFPAELAGPWPVEGYEVGLDFTDGVRLVCTRGGERLQALPSAVRDSGDMAWIRVVLDAARRHHRQIRDLLEAAMVEAIRLTDQDLAILALDPVGRSAMARILVEMDGVVGCPVPDDWLLETLTGDLLRLRGPVRIVHPVSLHASARLEGWSRWLNGRWFRQPFKQIHREWSLPNEAERDARFYSTRYAGDRIRWDQARALLEGRGWQRVTRTGAERRFRRAKLTAHLEFRTPATPGFPGTHVVINRLFFLPSGEYPVNRGNPGMPLLEVPPVLFSEAVRDAGLVSQVAGRS